MSSTGSMPSFSIGGRDAMSSIDSPQTSGIGGSDATFEQGNSFNADNVASDYFFGGSSPQ
jgi:hypothetical protein